MNTPKSLIFRYLVLLWGGLVVAPCSAKGDESPPYSSYFDSKAGFKASQRNFQAIFLQMAGSFEFYGSPEPYFRYVVQENRRVEAAYLKAKGKPATFRPEYFTEEYVEGLIRGWKQMAPTLALESFARSSGCQMRLAMLGSWNMAPSEMAGLETRLTVEEAAEFEKFVAKPYFKKSDFGTLDKFYADGNGYDKLSDAAKSELSKRIERGTMPPAERDADLKSCEGGTIILAILREHQKKSLAGIEGKGKRVSADDLQQSLVEELRLKEGALETAKQPTTQRDAFVYAHAIRASLNRRLTEIGKQADPELMRKVERSIDLILESLLVAAQCEYESGLISEYLEKAN